MSTARDEIKLEVKDDKHPLPSTVYDPEDLPTPPLMPGICMVQVLGESQSTVHYTEHRTQDDNNINSAMNNLNRFKSKKTTHKEHMEPSRRKRCWVLVGKVKVEVDTRLPSGPAFMGIENIDPVYSTLAGLRQ
ncbi:GL13075 [Drosophila persimilis]|uniref:GL13075 n=1 Tax=Drosophila persimilis TaxID=7234 RepID=B4GV11_DROPE|nr:GL13075 [Drosophila persimilis]